jgi:hypothetical protein
VRHDEPPLGFDCSWTADGRLVLTQDQTGSSLRAQDKEPTLYFDAEELPGLIESLRIAIGEEIIPDLRAEVKEQEGLINMLHEWARFPRRSEAAHIPPEKEKSSNSKGSEL